jgi:hypothetical protein
MLTTTNCLYPTSLRCHNIYFIAEKGHSVTGVYYSSAGLQHPNYRELLIPDLYADMMDRVSALLAAGGPKSFLNPGFLFTMFSEWSGLIQVLK